MKNVLLSFGLLFPPLASAQSNVIWPKQALEVNGHPVRTDVRVYAYYTRDLPRKDSVSFYGWITESVNYEKLEATKMYGREKMVLELLVERFFHYTEFSHRYVGYRYVNFDAYPTDLTVGDVDRMMRRIEQLEKNTVKIQRVEHYDTMPVVPNFPAKKKP